MNPDRIFALIGWKQARDQNSANQSRPLERGSTDWKVLPTAAGRGWAKKVNFYIGNLIFLILCLFSSNIYLFCTKIDDIDDSFIAKINEWRLLNKKKKKVNGKWFVHNDMPSMFTNKHTPSYLHPYPYLKNDCC